MNRFLNYSVLVVDDDRDSLECMCEYLSLEFSTIYSAMNTKRALEIAISKRPDIIFTDILMPDEDGFSLVEQIHSAGLEIPIVVVSAYDDKDKLFKAIKADIVDYLIKPLTSQKLQETMTLCSRRFEKMGAKVLLKDEFVWDSEKLLLLKGDKIIKLTNSETKILQILAHNIDTPVESIELHYGLSDYEQKEYSPKNIRNIIYKIRKKVGNKNFIENIYGSKYLLCSIESL